MGALFSCNQIKFGKGDSISKNFNQNLPLKGEKLGGSFFFLGKI